MICVIALIIFSILGIFSATHRKLAAEAFDCVFRKSTGRKCASGMDVRIKSKITGTFMKFSPKFGKIIYRHFELASWIFVILFIVTTAYLGFGAYNFYLYGNCYGPTDTGFCVFDPSGHNSQFTTEESCSGNDEIYDSLSLAGKDLSLFTKSSGNSGNIVFFVGCFDCQYTKEIYPVMKGLRNKTTFYFGHFPVNHADDNVTKLTNCAYYYDEEKYWDLIDSIFELNTYDFQSILDLAVVEGYVEKDLTFCVAKEGSQKLYDEQIEEMKSMGIYGTPTVFVNGEAIVGPKPLRVYERLLR